MRNDEEMPKERISITIRKEFLEWIDKKVDDLTYASRSHAIESLIADKIKET
jgi:metal-responsive CopG/Arc/MetJ family transcriptional regulator